ncbi:DUF11 domain-containing protein [candidate division WWE3 bacterium]|uniref:DUF11 domain-containing protein n=1 Tax=candidate division WWE3 bacterium TaxID=2053526 RepID=A0A955LH78_UNCKA|nr:DUF11 domain-containing protein [candidate division WWE3 bacterium]
MTTNIVKKTLLILPALFLSVLFIPQKAEASNCYNNYGVKVDCPVEEVSFSITKTADQEKIKPAGRVWFTVTVKNTGTITVDNVSVKDILPDELVWVEGDITHVYNNFKPGETRSFKVKAKPADNIVAQGGTTTAINRAQLTYKDIKLNAEATVVIESGSVLAANTLPETSAGYAIIGLMSGLAISVGAGLKELSDKMLK